MPLSPHYDSVKKELKETSITFSVQRQKHAAQA